jgi:hypothetical protein
MSRHDRSGNRNTSGPSGTGGMSYVSTNVYSRPTNIPELLEHNDEARRSSAEPVTDIKIVNVGQE